MIKQTTRGQVLVIVALSLLVLVAFVALAVDGGSIYRERRHMQNAADAGALAGAQEICFGVPADAVPRAEEYAITRNGAEGAVVTLSGGNTVTVVATRTVQTYFAGLVGFSEIPVQADATAACGKAGAGGGIWPIGFDQRRWPNVAGDPDSWCGEEIVLWHDGQADCEHYDCCHLYGESGDLIEGLNCTGETPRVYPLDGRTWVDFSAGITGSDPCDSGGCGADEVTDRIIGQVKIPPNQWVSCESFVAFPDCFAVPQGVKASSWSAIEAAAGRIVTIPLFDPCYSGKVGEPVIADAPETYCPADYGVCTMEKDPGNNCAQERFYINQLACLRIGVYKGTKPNGDEIWVATGYFQCKEGVPSSLCTGGRPKVTVATIPCDENNQPPLECGTAPGWTTGEVPLPGDIKAVSLID